MRRFIVRFYLFILGFGLSSLSFGQNIFISEAFDPPGFPQFEFRFVELYNPGPGSYNGAVGDTLWFIVNVGSTIDSVGFNLNNVTILPYETFTIGMSDGSSPLNPVFDDHLIAPGQFNTNWNGQERDGCRLVINGTMVDQMSPLIASTTGFFQDVSVQRDCDICSGSPNFDASEWIIVQANSIADASPNLHATQCQPPPFQFDQNDTTLCAGGGLQLTVSGTLSGNGYFSGGPFVDPVTGYFDATGLPPGDYEIEFIDSILFCEYEQEIEITIAQAPSFTLSVPADTICSISGPIPLGISGSTLTPTYSGTAGISSGTSLFNPTGLSGSYWIYAQITDNGCTAMDSAQVVVVDIPINLINNDTILCDPNSGTIALVGSPAGGQFVGTGIVTGTSIFDPSGLSSGDYTLYYEIDTANCTFRDSVTITLSNDPPPSIGNLPTTIGVYDPVIQLSGSPAGGTFTSATGGVSASGVFNPVTAGVGTHTITYSGLNAWGCPYTVSATVVVTPYSAFAYSGGLDTSLCYGSSILLQPPTPPNAGTTSYADSAITLHLDTFAGTIHHGPDDQFSDTVSLPFDFCFYGGVYDQLVFSTNNIISFDLSYANSFSSWTPIAIPDPMAPLNAIFGPWIDVDPSLGGTIRYGVLGTAPHRVAILSFESVPYFWCTSLELTAQIKLYEGSNYIEMHIADQPLCSGEDALQGLQDATGTNAYTIPGRNAQQYAVSNEARRFYPNGPSTTTWYGINGNVLNTGTSITPTITSDTAFYAIAGCPQSFDTAQAAAFTIQVDIPDTLTISPIPDTLCLYDAPINLTTNFTTGHIEINGQSISVFNPAVLGVGTHTVSAQPNTFPGNLCLAPSQKTITIIPRDSLYFQVDTVRLCINDAAVQFFPLYTTFSGYNFLIDGAAGNYFDPQDPSVVLNQPYAITFDVSAEICAISDTLWVIVVPEEQSDSYVNDTTICAGSPNLLLTGNFGSSGFFYGTGIIQNGPTFEFSPQMALAPVPNPLDTHTFQFYYIPQYTVVNCFIRDTIDITIVPEPVASLTAPDSVCKNAGIIGLMGLPAGGTFSGSGVSATGSFDPSNLALGDYDIEYAYISPDGCADTVLKTITVFDDAYTQLDFAADTFCISAGLQVPVNLPSTGQLVGPGVVNTGTTYAFDPQIAGVGTHAIYYLTPAEFCRDTLFTTLTVQAPVDAGQGNIIQKCVGNISSVNLFSNFLVQPNSLQGTWYDEQGNPVPNGIVSGSNYGLDTIQFYYVLSNVCNTDTATVELLVLPEPVAVGNGPVFISPGNSVTLPLNVYQGSNLQYNWSPGTLLIDSTVANPTTLPINQATTFVVSVKDSLSGCQDTALVEIFTNLSPLSLTLNASPPVACNGDSVLLTASISGGTSVYQIDWSPTIGLADSTGTSTMAQITSPITYFVTVYDGLDTIIDSISVGVDSITGVTFNPVSVICFNGGEQSITLGASLPGGVYSGPGISNGFLGLMNPMLTGLGLKEIIYTYTSPLGCTFADTHFVEVVAAPQLGMTTAPFFCASSPPDTLNFATPPGGIYSGPGITNNILDPALVGSGNTPIQYLYTDTNGCSSTLQLILNIAPLPNVNFNLPTLYCSEDAPFGLYGGAPLGGDYFGPGVQNDSLFPGMLGPGVFTLFYEYTNASGCVGIDSIDITVLGPDTITWPPMADMCVNEPALPLAVASPTGGAYSGPGVSGGLFYPGFAGAGTHSVTYTYVNLAGCVSSDTIQITVNPLPVMSLDTLANRCINDTAVLLTGGLPAGGVYFGPGVVGDTLTPSQAGVGIHLLGYAYTDSAGCTDTVFSPFEIEALPSPYLSSLAAVCYDAAPFELQLGSPAGGWYSGNGVMNDSLFPALAGPGTHILTYHYSTPLGCTDSTSITYMILGPPATNYPSLDTVCLDAGVQIISTATPVGGTYFGPSVTNGQFDPLAAGLGAHVIFYAYTDASGCSDTAQSTIVVVGSDSILWTPADTLFCPGDNAIDLTSWTQPTGGVFTGTGVMGNQFNPYTAGPGSHPIQYVHTTANGCVSTSFQVVTVSSPFNLSFPMLADVCQNDAPINLNTATPTGGNYFGAQVANNVFDPAVGFGDYTIGYEYTNPSGCRDTIYQMIHVDSTPVVTQIPYAGYCIDDPSFNLTGGQPGGGSYSGVGVSGGQFNPAVAGAGVHEVSYVFVAPTGCSDTAAFQVTVHDLPNVYAPQWPAVCDNDSAFTLQGAQPAGGVYYGDGVSAGNLFTPSIAGHGMQYLEYEYVDSNGCANRVVCPMEVYLSPPIPIVTEISGWLVCDWGFYLYQWYQDTTPIPGANNISYRPEWPGQYWVEITDANGCSSVSSWYTYNNVGLPSPDLESVRIYPNPTSGAVNIQVSEPTETLTCIVYNARGEQVFSQSEWGAQHMVLQLHELAAGTYFIETRTSNHQWTLKPIIIER